MSFSLRSPDSAAAGPVNAVNGYPTDSLDYQPNNEPTDLYEDPGRNGGFDWRGFRRLFNQSSAAPENLQRPRSLNDPYGHYNVTSQPLSNQNSLNSADNGYVYDQSDIRDRSSQLTDIQPKNLRDEQRGYEIQEQLMQFWGMELDANERQLEHLLRTVELFLKQLSIGDEKYFHESASSPNDCRQTLVRLLHNIIRCKNFAMQQTTAVTEHGVPIDIRRQLIGQIEHNILLCIQCLTKFESVRQNLLTDQVAIEVIARSSAHHSVTASNVVAIQILNALCDGPAGCRGILSAFTSNALVKTKRFEALIEALNNCDNLAFKAYGMKLFNSLWRHMKQKNFQISFRQELIDSGLQPDRLLQFSGSNGQLSGYLASEIREWNALYVTRRPITTQHAARDTGSMSPGDKDAEIKELRKEVKDLNDQLAQKQAELDVWQQAGENWKTSGSEWMSEKLELEQKCKKYSEIALEEKRLATKITELYRVRMGRDPEDDPQFNEARSTTKNENISESALLAEVRPTMANADNANNGGTAASIPLYHLRDTVRIKVTNHPSVALLNWTPISSTDSTIFQELNVENVIRELDFSEFDAHFAVSTSAGEKNESDGMAPTRKSFGRRTDRIEFVENNRAKNMNITLRKISLSLPDLRMAIETCDNSCLPGEFAELLIKFIPTRDEIKRLNEIDSAQYVNLGEAELFVYCMSLIDRLEAKLSIMTFIGQYEEVITTLAPNIPLLRSAADSVCCSAKLRAVFEVILAFGNYMNTSRKGFILGFKLDSLAKLSEVKSRINKSITLLHFIVRVIEIHYPQISDFYNELDIDLSRSVSYQAITNAIQVLRRGDDIIREEIRLQPENKWINSFYMLSSPVISQLLTEYHDMQDSYRAACDMFGENFRLVEPQELFGPITTFIGAFKKAMANNAAGTQMRSLAQAEKKQQAQVKVYRNQLPLASGAVTSPDLNAEKTSSANQSATRGNIGVPNHHDYNNATASPSVDDVIPRPLAAAGDAHIASSKEQQMSRISSGLFFDLQAVSEHEQISAF